MVVEAGPDAGRQHYRSQFDEPTADSLWLQPENDPHFWRPYTANGVGFTGIAGLRRRLGGRSLYWHGVVMPIEDWALAEGWPAEVVRDLTVGWAGGPPLFDRVEADLAAWAYGSGTTLVTHGDSINLAGYHFQSAPRAVRPAMGGSGWEAYSPLFDLTDDIELLCGGYVREVLQADQAIDGVRVDTPTGTYDIQASRVVLAAGTVENSRLAIQALAMNDLLPAPILSGLVDKIAQGFVATFALDDLPADLRQAALVGRVLVTPTAGPIRSNLFLVASTNRFGIAVIDVYLMGEQHPSASGVVSCKPGSQSPWPVSVRCEPCVGDALVITRQRDELRRVWEVLCAITGTASSELAFAEGLGSAFGSADLPSRLQRARRLQLPSAPCTYAFPLGSEQHEAGTLPFGSILDDQQQFHAIPGLFAVGPCCFPRTGAANPAMTILALSMRLSAFLRRASPAS